MFCQKCGTKNSDDASLCVKCGNNLKSTKPKIELKGITGKLGKMVISGFRSLLGDSDQQGESLRAYQAGMNQKLTFVYGENYLKYLSWVVIYFILTSSVAAAERELIQGEEDKLNIIYSVEIGKDGVPPSQAKAILTTIPPENIKIEKVTGKPKANKIPEEKPEKIHCKLLRAGTACPTIDSIHFLNYYYNCV